MKGLVLISQSMLAALATCIAFAASAQAESKTVYRCPGNPPLYTDTMSVKEAKDKGCRTVEGAPVTVVQTVRPRSSGSVSLSASGAAPSSRPADQRVDPSEQRARDSDARRILASELAREEEQLAALQKEFNSGEPERRGDERNYQKYLDRVSQLKASIARKESDIAALKRELGKLPQ